MIKTFESKFLAHFSSKISFEKHFFLSFFFGVSSVNVKSFDHRCCKAMQCLSSRMAISLSIFWLVLSCFLMKILVLFFLKDISFLKLLLMMRNYWNSVLLDR